jgi:hypothetical protein
MFCEYIKHVTTDKLFEVHDCTSLLLLGRKTFVLKEVVSEHVCNTGLLQMLTAVLSTVLWDVTSYIFVYRNQSFKKPAASIFSIICYEDGHATSSVRFIHIYHITQFGIPEDRILLFTAVMTSNLKW